MSESYDAIVVGSGAGGAAAAYRLVLGGLKVVVLEKGGALPVDGSTLDIHRVVHEGRFLSHEPWLDARGRRFTPEEHFNVGGKTKWYGAALVRLDTSEFYPAPAHQCLGWPLYAPDLAPYYEEAERLLEVRTFDCEPDLTRLLKPLSRQWRSSPMPLALAPDILADRAEAAHFDGFSSVRGLKREADRSILSSLAAHGNFSLWPNAAVQSLLGEAQSPATVTGVRLFDGRELRAPRVLLAAGALHSPRLLSRYLAETRLAESLPAAAQVGRYLKLHLLTALVAISPGPKTDLIRKTVLLTHDRFRHSSVQPLGFDGELIATLMPRFLPSVLRRAIGSRAYGFFLQTEDGSDARNRVVASLDGASLPVMDYDEERLPAARDEHRALVRAFQRSLGRIGFLSFARRIGLSGTAHACGSMICGRDAHSSVVDVSGRVHGMQGLYVTDGSILPRLGRANPSLTIYAWGLRVGDLVAAEFQRGRESRRASGPESRHA